MSAMSGFQHLADSASALAMPGQLDLFSVLPTQDGVERTAYERVQLVNFVTDTGPYEIKVL